MANLKIVHSQVILVEEIFETTIEVEDDFDVDSTNLLFILETDDWVDPRYTEVLDATEQNILEWEWV